MPAAEEESQAITDAKKGRAGSVLFWAALTAVLILHVAINRQADFSFPAPWPDEAHFFWQAHAIAVDNSLYSEALNSDRTIMWQPPGYFVVTGTAFKVLGTSFETGRLLSLVWLLGAFALMVTFFSRYGLRWPALILSGLFFFNARFLACGNIVRMESLLLLTVFAGFVLIQRRKTAWGLSLLCITPLIHFNGVLFLPAGIALAAVSGQMRDLRLNLKRSGWTPIALAALAWLGFLTLVLFNRESFLHDMAYQFGRKTDRTLWPVLAQPENLIALVVVIGGIAHGLKTRFRASELLVASAPFWLAWSMGREVWYEVLTHIGFLMITVYAFHLWLYWFPVSGDRRRRLVRVVAAAFLLALLIAWNFRVDRIENPLDYRVDAEMFSMDMEIDIPYFVGADREAVTTILEGLAPENALTEVEFEPLADGLFFQHLDTARFRLRAPVFEERLPDVHVIHVSKSQPHWWSYGDEALERYGLTRDSTRFIQYQRDLTERWYFCVIPKHLKMGKRSSR
ncbi:MAG: hypothetical protein GY867_06610 [bacterium]|nr:hypothetical protein [bacterium]